MSGILPNDTNATHLLKNMNSLVTPMICFTDSDRETRPRHRRRQDARDMGEGTRNELEAAQLLPEGRVKVPRRRRSPAGMEGDQLPW